jgi:hypothetical protein
MAKYVLNVCAGNVQMELYYASVISYQIPVLHPYYQRQTHTYQRTHQ